MKTLKDTEDLSKSIEIKLYGLYFNLLHMNSTLTDFEV